MGPARSGHHGPRHTWAQLASLPHLLMFSFVEARGGYTMAPANAGNRPAIVSTTTTRWSDSRKGSVAVARSRAPAPPPPPPQQVVRCRAAPNRLASPTTSHPSLRCSSMCCRHRGWSPAANRRLQPSRFEFEFASRYHHSCRLTCSAARIYVHMPPIMRRCKRGRVVEQGRTVPCPRN